MIIIGLLVIIAALIFGVELIFQNHHHVSDIRVFGQGLGLHNEAAILVIGVIIGAAIIIALALIASGVRRKGSKAVVRHMEHKEVKHTRGQRDELASENERLRVELAARRATEEAATGGRPAGTADRPAGTADRPAGSLT